MAEVRIEAGAAFDVATSADVAASGKTTTDHMDTLIRDWNRGLKVMRFPPGLGTVDDSGNVAIDLPGPRSGYVWQLRRVTVYGGVPAADNAAAQTLIPVAQPTAGSAADVFVPADQTWKLQSVFYEVVTDAVSQDRMASIKLFDNSAPRKEWCRIVAPNTFSASTTQFVTFGLGLDDGFDSDHSSKMTNLPDLWLPPLTDIHIVPISISVGDQLSNIVIMAQQKSVSSSTGIGPDGLSLYRTSDGTADPRNFLTILPGDDSWFPGSKSVFLMQNESLLASGAGLTPGDVVAVSGEAVEVPAEMIGKLL